jgi:hypothetical protein
MEKADNTLDKLFLDIDNENSEFSKIKLRFHNNENFVFNSNLIIKHIILQIVSALDILTSEYDFFHGDLKAGNIFYKIDDDYLNNLVNDGYSNIRIKIADYGKCSMTFDDKRYFCREAKAQYIVDTYVAIRDVTSLMEDSIQVKTLSIDNKKYPIHTFEYKIHKLFEIRHVGCPTFNSIDFYILIVSLCFQCPIFHEFCQDSGIIDSLFLGKIKTITTSSTNKASVVPANSFLKGKRLICEAFQIVVQLMNLIE